MPNIIQIKRGDADVLDQFGPLEDGELAVTKHTQITGGPQAGEKVLDSTLRVGIVSSEHRDYAVVGSETVIYESSYFVHIVSLLSQYCKNIENTLRNDFINTLTSLKNNLNNYEDIIINTKDIVGNKGSDIFGFLDITSYKLYPAVSYLFGLIGTPEEAVMNNYIVFNGITYSINKTIMGQIEELKSIVGNTLDDTGNLVYNSDGTIKASIIKVLNNLNNRISALESE